MPLEVDDNGHNVMLGMLNLSETHSRWKYADDQSISLEIMCLLSAEALDSTPKILIKRFFRGTSKRSLCTCYVRRFRNLM